MDTITSNARSRNMARIRSQGTKPELAVRSAAHRAGFRFRLQRRDLPGTPDLVFPRLNTALFVHGCFWHGHPGCLDGRIPKSRRDYWEPKLAGNKRRDAKNQRRLRSIGWRVVVVWECETLDPPKLCLLLRDLIGNPKRERALSRSPRTSPEGSRKRSAAPRSLPSEPALKAKSRLASR
ncbi:MAG TPA: very short patch repair endonuclease [Terriglobales bacterium]